MRAFYTFPLRDVYGNVHRYGTLADGMIGGDFERPAWVSGNCRGQTATTLESNANSQRGTIEIARGGQGGRMRVHASIPEHSEVSACVDARREEVLSPSTVGQGGRVGSHIPAANCGLQVRLKSAGLQERPKATTQWKYP